MLLLRLVSPANITIGALGKIHFDAGCYVYCGSARRNLGTRLSRHMSCEKKLRWHIDYLTSRKDVSIEGTRIFPLDGVTECKLNRMVQDLSQSRAIAGFGCSDCGCRSHLTFFGQTMPDLRPDGKGFHGE